MSRERLLLVDSYDSFTHNLAHGLAAAGASVEVVTIDDARLDSRSVRRYDGIVLGPGPGGMEAARDLASVVEWSLAAALPLLGICLGLQAIAVHYGARIERAPRPMHGERSPIVHDGSGLFQTIPSPFNAMRYHSLCVEPGSFSPELHVNAVSEDGVIQGLRHVCHPIHGVQFHPESFLAEHGATLFAAFVELAKASLPVSGLR